MKLEITIDGKTYVSVATDKVTPSEAAEQIYNQIDAYTKLKVDLEDGGVLVIGKEAVQRAVIIFKP